MSFQKPFKPVRKDTISRWIKNVLKYAGIDTTKFGAHSTKAASISAAAKAGTPLDVILKSAGWSNCGTFAKFYKKPINTQCNFGSALFEANRVDAKPIFCRLCSRPQGFEISRDFFVT